MRSQADPAADGLDVDLRSLLDALFANSDDALVLVDATGAIRYATVGVLALLGFDPESAVEPTLRHLLHPDDSVDDLVAASVGDAERWCRLRQRAGGWLLANAAVARLPIAGFESIAVTFRPVEDGAPHRVVARRGMAATEFVNQLGADLLGVTDHEGVIGLLRRSLPEIAHLADADAAFILIESFPQRDEHRVDSIAEWRGVGPSGDIDVDLDHPIVRDLLERPWSADPDPTAQDGLDLSGFVDAERVGIVSEPFSTSMRRGAVVLVRTRSNRCWFDTDVQLVRGIAHLTGRSIRSGWSELLLESMLDLGPVGVSIRTFDNVAVLCNQRFLDIYGFDDQAQVVDLPSMVVPGHLRHVAREHERLRSGEADHVHAEFQAVRVDGRRIWVRSNATRVRLPGSADDLLMACVVDVTTSREQQMELEHAATHDALTGVANRSAMLDWINARVDRDGATPAVIVIDLDRFKLVNDSLGHLPGDAVLRSVADRLRNNVRDGDFVARLGGDEFAVVLGGGDAATAGRLADRVRHAFREPIAIDGREVVQTLSIGVAAGGPDISPDALLLRADRALLTAKRQGRNRHVLFDESMLEEMAARGSIERELRGALARGEIDVYFQPEFALEDRRIVGAEALLRWHHPERGTLAAYEFIDVAEESGLIEELGRLALRRSTSRFVEISRQLGREELTLRVNISAREFNQPELGPMVVEALGQSGLSPTLLCLEMTETTLMDSPEIASATLARLRRIGVRFAIDDFGTGYSSLGYLKRLPVDVVKIDRSFVSDIADDPDSRAIVATIVALCAAMSLSPVAEGVETEDQVAVLRELGCQSAQGYLVAPGLSADEFVGRYMD